MYGCFMPIAVCIVDFGLRRALRASDALRPANARKVMMIAQLTKKFVCDGAARAA